MEFNQYEIDKIQEIINIGVGQSAGTLNKLLNKRVKLHVPTISILTAEKLLEKIEELGQYKVSAVNMFFEGAINGVAELVFPTTSASKIIDIFTDEKTPSEEIDQLRSNTLNEVGNIILNSLLGTISNFFKTRLNFKLPKYFEGSSGQMVADFDLDNKLIILAEAKFTVLDTDIEGQFILFLELKSIDKFKELLKTFG